MNLTRLFAYEVFPQKNQEEPMQPKGGKITISEGLRHTLTELLSSSQLTNQAPIAFHVEDPRHEQKQNDVRKLVMQFAYGNTLAVKNSSEALALRLSSVMDGRSKPFLLLVSAFSGNDSVRVVFWAFPKDEGLKFELTHTGAQVEVISDIFNISSTLRKAALFDGVNSPDSFWEGRMIDFQSGRTDFWVENFLECRLSTSGVYGTQLLAEYLADAYKKADSSEARESIFNAIVAVRTRPVRRISHLRFANDYLNDDAKNMFLATVPEEEHRVLFDFDRDVFETKIGFRAFKMQDDVYLSAPFGAIGESVKIVANRLEYVGEISKEYLRASGGR